MNGETVQAAKIGVIGDVHLFWDHEDVAFFNRSDYDLLLFVGDLAAYTQFRGLRVARSIGKLRVPAMCILGNHDGLHALQLGSEIFPRARRLRGAFCLGQRERCNAFEKALGLVQIVAYSQHRVELSGVPINIVAARPHSIGGRRPACLAYLKGEFGIESMGASAARLQSLVDACDDAPILFLAHNGPIGLGDHADSIWGCDFRNQEEDWGDRDLAEAIDYAHARGRKVLGAVAGHMHRRTKKGRLRPGQINQNGVLYVNAAEVPRHRRQNGIIVRHHVRLKATRDTIEAEDIWV